MVSTMKIRVPKVLNPINIKDKIDKILEREKYKDGVLVIWKDSNYFLPKIHLSNKMPYFPNEREIKQKLDLLFKEVVKASKSQRDRNVFGGIEGIKERFLPDLTKIDFFSWALDECLISPRESIIIPINKGRLDRYVKSIYVTLIYDLESCYTKEQIKNIKDIHLFCGFIK